MELLTADKSRRVYQMIGAYAESMPLLSRKLKSMGNMSCFYQRMTEMYGHICEAAEKERKDITGEEMKKIMQMTAEDIFHEFKEDASFLNNGKFLSVIAWRTGLVFALTPDVKCSRINQKIARFSVSLIRFEQKKYCRPEEQLLCLLILMFDGIETQKAEELLDSIIDQTGLVNAAPAAFAKESTVCAFAHPYDSDFIRLLDTPMVNSLFRNLVDVNADLNMGQMLATGIAVNEKNYPDVNRVVDDCVKMLRIRRPYVVVSGQIQGINAMTFGSDEEPYMVISTMLVKVMNEGQLRFVIGHECGHIAMGHVIYHTAAGMLSVFGRKSILLGKTISVGLNAWSRRSEITADRAGLICCGELETAKKALVQIECGFKSAEDIDIDTYMQESRNYLDKGMLRRVGEYGASHPLLPKRIEALTEFSGSRMYYRAAGADIPETAISDYALSEHVERVLKVV